MKLSKANSAIQSEEANGRMPAGADHIFISYAWEDPAGEPGHETVVTVRFADEDGKTRLTLHQALFENVASRDSHQSGWTSCMERFAQYLVR